MRFVVFRWVGWAVVMVLLLATTSPGWAQESRRCVRADVPWAFVLPDGSVHEAGQLRLCLKQAYSPVAGLHEMYVNGIPQGLTLSDSRNSESRTVDNPVVVFERAQLGPFRLIGYAWPRAGRTRAHVLYSPGGNRADVTVAESLLEAVDDGTTLVSLVASRD